VLSLFFDLRQDLSEGMLKTIYAFPQRLQDVLKGLVNVSVTFTHTGIKGMEMNCLDKMRENAGTIFDFLQQNRPGDKLMLTAQAPLMEDGYCWNPAMLLLDGLRRGGQMVSAAGNVGYCSYNAYEEKDRRELEDQIELLTAMLSDKEDNQLENALTREVERLEKSVSKDFVVRGGLQPQHPDMIVGPSFLDLKRREARNGRGPYAAASEATKEATNKTALYLGEQIRDRFALTTEGADSLLASMIVENRVSPKWLKQSEKVKKALVVSYGEKTGTGMLTLSYDEGGCKGEISKYLNKHIDAALYDGKVAYCKALQEAYTRHSASHDYDDEIRQMELEKANLEERLVSLPTAKNFCDANILTEDELSCDFNPLFNRTSSSLKFAFWENEDQETGKLLQQVENNFANNTTIYSNNFTNNLAKGDGAPIKVIKLSLYDCQKSDFDTLIV
jgi:hypothetical protein